MPKKISYTSLNKDSSSKNRSTFVCSICYPFALEIGQITGIGSLIYMANQPKDTLTNKAYGKGKFALLGGQGHRDDETIIFDERPAIEDGWRTPTTMNVNLNEAVIIYDYAKKFGNFNPVTDGSLTYFLVTKIDHLIKRWEKKNGKVETFYKKFVKERETHYNHKVKS